jgi:hypothetical protein
VELTAYRAARRPFLPLDLPEDGVLEWGAHVEVYTLAHDDTRCPACKLEP